jgi:uncharacterized membrane protein (DUF4010 family)
LPDPTNTLIASSAWRLFVALAIGIVIGIERERRKGEGAKRGAAGLRTFALVSLLGGLSAHTNSVVLVTLAGTFTGAAALLGYWLGDRTDPGLTTEVALMATFILGVLAQAQPLVALGAGVAVTLLLAVRTALHHFARDVLTERELLDGLIFFIAAAVVLPILPDRPIDPLRLFNPFALWRLAVVLMALSAAGYIALRLLGPRFGLAIAGFASGFVSSTACIASMGSRARENEHFAAPGAGGAIASTIGSLVYLSGLVATADLDVLRQLVKPFGVAIVTTVAYAIFLAGTHGRTDDRPNEPGRAFDLKTVVLFASMVAVFSLISAGLIGWLGNDGALGSAVATGLVDVHAAAVSIATLMAAGKITARLGSLAILVALTTNMVSKIPAAFAAGPRPFALRVTLGIVALLAGLWSGYAWQAASRGVT